MLRTAFSTVACPDWTLERAARFAAEAGFDGVELRTEGHGATAFACDPALTAAAKVRQMFAQAGVQLCSLGSTVRFDEPITLGMRIWGDPERPVRECKSIIDLATRLEAPLVRVFAFEHSPRESRARASARIVDRLRLAVDAARHSGVRLALENGGSFPTAADVIELVERVSDPLLGVSYSMPVAWACGEDPAEGVALLRSLLWLGRLKDFRGTTPCPLGEGDLPCRRFVEVLAAADSRAWIVYEWDRAWLTGLEEPDVILPQGAQTLYEWLGHAARTVRSG